MFIRNIMKVSPMLHDSHGSCASRASCGVTKELKTADILRGVEEEMALQLVNCHSHAATVTGRSVHERFLGLTWERFSPAPLAIVSSLCSK